MGIVIGKINNLKAIKNVHFEILLDSSENIELLFNNNDTDGFGLN